MLRMDTAVVLSLVLALAATVAVCSGDDYSGVTCDFDNGWCGWNQLTDTDDDFNLLRDKGPTPSANTGPVADHTTGHGYFVYLEASNRHPGDKGRIQSITVNPRSNQQCFSFWYHMHGDHIGTLSVYSHDLVHPTFNDTLLWTINGDQGSSWIKGSFVISENSSYNIIVEMTTDNGYLGDIAIDDAKLFDGDCPFDPLATTPRPITVDDCPPGLPRDESLQVHGNICYQFVLNHRRDYTSARHSCAAHGGTLALVKSAVTSDYLTNLMQTRYQSTQQTVWIGLWYRRLDGIYFWEDGTNLYQSRYANWAPGQGPLGPHGSSDFEGCVALNVTDGTWRDNECTPILGQESSYMYMPYICQYSI